MTSNYTEKHHVDYQSQTNRTHSMLLLRLFHVITEALGDFIFQFNQMNQPNGLSRRLNQTHKLV